MRWRSYRPKASRTPWSSNRAPSSIEDQVPTRDLTPAPILDPIRDQTRGLILDRIQVLIRDPILAPIRALVAGNENLTGGVRACSQGHQPSDLNLEFDHR